MVNEAEILPERIYGSGHALIAITCQICRTLIDFRTQLPQTAFSQITRKTNMADNAAPESMTVITSLEVYFTHLTKKSAQRLLADFGERASCDIPEAKMTYKFIQPRVLPTDELNITIFGLVSHMKPFFTDRGFRVRQMVYFTHDKVELEQAIAAKAPIPTSKFEVNIND